MMSLRGSFRRCCCRVLAIAVLHLPMAASANPVAVTYTEIGGQCADHASIGLTDEVGLGMPIGPFETLESITYSVTPATDGDCAIGVAGGDDFRVVATNTTNHCLVDVFVAADGGTTFDNWDGTVLGFPAKKITSFWADATIVAFELLNVAPVAAPDFASLGVGFSPAPSNFSIVANRDTDCDGVPDGLEAVPALTERGHALLILLMAAAGALLVRQRAGRSGRSARRRRV